mmetsp:Transcript_38251/g.59698  ORF Transcript_38251/g.59698 Transcript_38251/m.59698 type:complete len:200 (+) Transcript_38251:128-727(+)
MCDKEGMELHKLPQTAGDGPSSAAAALPEGQWGSGQTRPHAGDEAQVGGSHAQEVPLTEDEQPEQQLEGIDASTATAGAEDGNEQQDTEGAAGLLATAEPGTASTGPMTARKITESCTSWMSLPMSTPTETERGDQGATASSQKVNQAFERSWGLPDWLSQPLTLQESIRSDVSKSSKQGVVVSYLHDEAGEVTPLFTM